MTPERPGDRPRHFTNAELDGVPELAPEDLAAERRLASEIEAVADRGTVRPSADFADRVMRAVAAEPGPAPARAAGAALRRGSLGSLLGSIRDAWRVSTGTGFPIAARAQATALVLVVVGFAAGSGIATAGALGAFNDQHSTVAPTPTVPAATVPEGTSTPDGTPPPQPTDGSLDPALTATPDASDATENPSSEPLETLERGESPDGNAGTPGAGGGDGGSGSKDTPRPTGAPRPSDTPEPTSTGEDGGNGGSGHTPDPSWRPGGSPWPSHTPEPTPGR